MGPNCALIDSLDGLYIAEAPNFIGSFGVLVDGAGPWYGGLQLRVLGSYPLNPDNVVRGRGYDEVNVDVGYKITPLTKVQLSIYNLFAQKPMRSTTTTSRACRASRWAGSPTSGATCRCTRSSRLPHG